MHRVFQAFIDGLLAASGDIERLRTVLANAGSALDLSVFAYLSMPSRRGDTPELISNYPVDWTDHYLREHYERVDPVIVEALTATEPFEWGQEFTGKRLSKPQCTLLDEAVQFGIRCGFTVPVHDFRGPVAAITFAADERRPAFQRCIEQNRSVLQLMAMYFHAHARRRLSVTRSETTSAISPAPSLSKIRS